MQIFEHIEPWVLVSMGILYSVLFSILLSAFWDLLTKQRRDPLRQEIFFDKYADMIEFSIAAGPLIGLFSTNMLGSQALSKAAPVLSGTANGSAQMGEMFTAIAAAMSATSLGIGLALTGFVVSLLCRWIYQVEPVQESEPISEATTETQGLDYKEIIRKEAAAIFKRPKTEKSKEPQILDLQEVVN